MRLLRSLSAWFRSRSPSAQTVMQNLFVWAVAIAIVWYLGRGLTIHQAIRALKRSDLTLFVFANVGSFVIRWLADTYLFSRLFSFFHPRTTYREVASLHRVILPTSTQCTGGGCCNGGFSGSAQ